MQQLAPILSGYGIIGNGRTAALVDRMGSIDWCCWPRFDSPAVFCRLLDDRRGGYFQIAPDTDCEVSREYEPGTNVLATTFTTAGGRLRLTDFMPAPRDAEGLSIPHRILRRVEGLSGRVPVRVNFRPTFQYARGEAELTPHRRGAIAVSGDESLSLAGPLPLQREHEMLTGSGMIAAGDEWWFVLTHGPRDAAGRNLESDDLNAQTEYERTLDYWRDWSAACTWEGPRRELINRSALTLKLLFFQPSGGLVASPTTSLPETIGGVRNWDYRYTWLRDSGLVLDVLQQLGYHDESLRFIKWFERLGNQGVQNLKVMYTVDGEALPAEQTLDHLAGYRDSRPVRIGNTAVEQTQLDLYGHVLDAIVLCIERMPRPVRTELWELLTLLADQAAAGWQKTDRGPWEMRGAPQHFLYSKLYCQVGLDRAIRLAREHDLPGNIDRWERERDALGRAILDRGWNAEQGTFTQVLEGSDLDASVLTLPLTGFLAATDPRMRSTMERVEQELTTNGLVYRYRNDDGLPGREGAFVLCSFWMVSNLALAGRLQEAEERFEHVCSYANDLGLLAEEIDPATGELLGNFPLGFAHLGLIRAAMHLTEAARQS